VQYDEIKKQLEELLELREFDEARAILCQAIEAAPDDAALHDLMGYAEAEADRYDAARTWFAKAIALEPQNARYRLHLAYQWLIAGDFTQAREEYERVLALKPRNPSAHMHLVMMTDIKPGDPIIDKLEKLKRLPDAPEDVLISYCYALGKCYDDIGEYDRAFENYKAANDRLSGRFDLARTRGAFELIKKVWTKEFSAERGDWGYRSNKPVFIVGMPRSGSTLLAQKLSKRPDVADLGERKDMYRIDAAIQKNHPLKLSMFLSAADLQKEAFRELGEWYVGSLSADAPHAARFIDKNNVNWPYLGMMRAILPDALILESRRNAIATCLSCYFADILPTQSWAFSLESLGQYYRIYDDLMRHWKETLPRVVSVQYEDMVENPDGMTGEIHEMMGLDERAEGSGQHKKEIRTLSAVQARRPIYKTSIERWRNYEKHLGPLFDALGDLAA
jgi:tetratricopeptide (TPR) repeat protein